MDPEIAFSIANLLPLPIWITWMVAPRSALARRLATSTWPWLVLGALYAALLIVELVAGGAPEGGSFSSLEGVMILFDSEWGTLAGWVHFLCFDLFVARWIVNDAPDAGYKLVPILFFTLMLGPVGLLLYLAFRSRLGGATP